MHYLSSRKIFKVKVNVLKALGVEIIRTPTEASHDAPESHISVAKTIAPRNSKFSHFG